MLEPRHEDASRAHLRVPFAALFEFGRGDRLAIDRAIVYAWIVWQLAVRGERAYPCKQWIAQGLGWGYRRTDAALASLVSEGSLKTWQEKVTHPNLPSRRKGKAWAHRYVPLKGGLAERRAKTEWMPITAEHWSCTAVQLGSILEHGYEQWHEGCSEVTTSELASLLQVSDGHARWLKRWLRGLGLLHELVPAVPGKRFAVFNYSMWFGGELEDVDYLGTMLRLPRSQKQRTPLCRQLLGVRDQLDKSMHGDQAVRDAAAFLRERMGGINPTARQVVRWLRRRYAWAITGNANTHRELLRSVSRPAERDEAKRARVWSLRTQLESLELELAGAPPG